MATAAWRGRPTAGSVALLVQLLVLLGTVACCYAGRRSGGGAPAAAGLAHFNASDLGRHQMRDLVHEMFMHAYRGYMKKAFPADQLAPLSCGPYSRKSSDYHLGNYALTLVESLSTLAAMGEAEEFRWGVDWLSNHLRWHNTMVSVFEVNIRVLGGLLSAHMLATDEELGLHPHYNGRLLDHAKALGDILLEAFETEIPANKINLGTRVTDSDSQINLAAGTTFLLEFGILSRLTGDLRFETAAEAAVSAFWRRRTSLNLVGSLFNRRTDKWVRDPHVSSAGLGSGSDSFYEYLLKYYIQSGDHRYWEMWTEAYQAILRYMKNDHWYVDVDIETGQPSRNWVDTFQAFFPSLMVLAGDIENATHMFSAYHSMLQHYGFIPEVYKHRTQEMHFGNWPLRPELAESTWYLYYATKDDYYLGVGKAIVQNLQQYCRTKCGFAAIVKIADRTTEDQMDSFFLSETLKYLYLLYDEDNFLNRGNYIFNTEGHPFLVSSAVQKDETTPHTKAEAAPRCAPSYRRSQRHNFFHHRPHAPWGLFSIHPKSYSRND